MDDYMFSIHVNGCKYVQELTTYLEIFNYSVSPVQLVQGCSPYEVLTLVGRIQVLILLKNIL